MKLNLEQINKKKEEIVESITKKIMSIEYNEIEVALAEIAMKTATIIAEGAGLGKKETSERIQTSNKIADQLVDKMKVEILGMCIVALEAEAESKEDQVGEA